MFRLGKMSIVQHSHVGPLALVFLLCGLGNASTNGCDFPPSLWCSSDIIAKQCNVYDQCKEHLTPATGSAATPVNFALYLESLCPDCKEFVKSQLDPVYTALGPRVMNLTLIPYGNAREKQDPSGEGWEFTCQHGKEECIGNLIESCAIVLLKNISVYFPFIACMEKKDGIFIENYAMECAKQYQIDLDPIMTCANGRQGNAIEHHMAEITNQLQPPHKYVPWVTLNGVHTEDIQNEAQDDLLKLICDTYKGETPPACKKFSNSSRRCQRDVYFYNMD